MIEAFLKGKLSSEQENMEDLLTSAVFGILREFDANSGLLPFLFKSVPILGDIPISPGNSYYQASHHDYEFWPTWSNLENVDNCEPDLVIKLQSIEKSYLVCIEAKFRSGKSSFPTLDGDITDQLAKQWAHLAQKAKYLSCEPWLIYLTADSYPPRRDILAALDELDAKSWPAKQEFDTRVWIGSITQVFFHPGKYQRACKHPGPHQFCAERD